jgi:hypothetical protein
MVGILLFQNVSRVDWKSIKDSAPAFVVLFFIPFTYSLIEGVLIGYGVYIFISLFTGEFYYGSLDLYHIYFTPSSPSEDQEFQANLDLDTKEQALLPSATPIRPSSKSSQKGDRNLSTLPSDAISPRISPRARAQTMKYFSKSSMRMTPMVQDEGNFIGFNHDEIYYNPRVSEERPGEEEQDQEQPGELADSSLFPRGIMDLARRLSHAIFPSSAATNPAGDRRTSSTYDPPVQPPDHRPPPSDGANGGAFSSEW